jgi:hypothetical protein
MDYMETACGPPMRARAQALPGLQKPKVPHADTPGRLVRSELALYGLGGTACGISGEGGIWGHNEA